MKNKNINIQVPQSTPTDEKFMCGSFSLLYRRYRDSTGNFAHFSERRRFLCIFVVFLVPALVPIFAALRDRSNPVPAKIPL